MTVTAQHEAVIAEEWLDALLSSSGAVTELVGRNIYRAVATDPLEDTRTVLVEGAAVVFQYLSGLDVSVVRTGPRRVMSQALYVVKAVGPHNEARLADVATALEQLLDGAQGAQDGAQLTAVRAGTVNYSEVAAGRLYDHLGATWRLEIA